MKNINELIMNSVRKFGEKRAVEDESNVLTYKQLGMLAGTVGTFLSGKGFFQKPIIVLCNRNIESVVMLLGVVLSGNIYVPIDISQPKERIRKMLCIVDPCAVLGVDETRTCFIENDNIRYYTYNECINTRCDDTVLKQISKRIQITDTLNCIFTSGSTGIPKAVVKSHRSILSMVKSFESFINFSCDEIFGSQSPIDFDISNKTIYISLNNGCTVSLIPRNELTFPGKLIRYINERKITSGFWSTAALSIIARFDAMKNTKPQYLKKLMFSGEKLSVNVLNYWKTHSPETQLINLYGTTEMAGNALYHIIDKEKNYDIVPIGKALTGVTVYLFNDKGMAIVSPFEKGEIVIQGNVLADGYYNDVLKTNEVFIRTKENEVLYKTGDIGYFDDNGIYYFLGRNDDQIKKNGYRIELDEIERVAESFEFIFSCCCIYSEKNNKIVLFYESEEEADCQLLLHLKASIPPYMMPDMVIFVKKMPLNPHGKKDKHKLKEAIYNGEICV